MVLTARKIHRNLPEKQQIKDLYKRAFPPKERIPSFILQIIMAVGIMDAMAFYDDNKLCGFAYVIEQEQIVMLMYLAVNDQMRNKGYGSQILSYLKNIYSGKRIILDVEEADDKADNAKQRRRRIDFYKRNGFYDTNQYFTIRGVKYLIMSTDPEFSENEYNDFWKAVGRRKQGS